MPEPGWTRKSCVRCPPSRPTTRPAAAAAATHREPLAAEGGVTRPKAAGKLITRPARETCSTRSMMRCVLTRQAFGGERGFGIGGGGRGGVLQQRAQRLVAPAALGAVLDVFDALPRVLGAGDVADRRFDQLRVREVAARHAVASGAASSVRSLRTARNRCTRTVASLRPSAWLTSLVV